MCSGWRGPSPTWPDISVPDAGDVAEALFFRPASRLVGGMTVSTGRRARRATLLVARAYLSGVAEPATIPIWAVRRAGRAGRAAAAMRAGRPRPRSLVPRRAGPRDAHADLETAERHGMRLVVPESSDWPHFALGALERAGRAACGSIAGARRMRRRRTVPPLALWVKGLVTSPRSGIRSVAIVGARAATAYGEE